MRTRRARTVSHLRWIDITLTNSQAAKSATANTTAPNSATSRPTLSAVSAATQGTWGATVRTASAAQTGATTVRRSAVPPTAAATQWTVNTRRSCKNCPAARLPTATVAAVRKHASKADREATTITGTAATTATGAMPSHGSAVPPVLQRPGGLAEATNPAAAVAQRPGPTITIAEHRMSTATTWEPRVTTEAPHRGNSRITRALRRLATARTQAITRVVVTQAILLRTRGIKLPRLVWEPRRVWLRDMDILVRRRTTGLPSRRRLRQMVLCRLRLQARPRLHRLRATCRRLRRRLVRECVHGSHASMSLRATKIAQASATPGLWWSILTPNPIIL